MQPVSQHPVSQPARKLSGLLFTVILTGLLLSGCNLLPTTSSEHIQEPPLIPEPSTDITAPQSEMTSKPLITAYADLIDFNDLSKHHPQLHDAVSTAIQVGVLKPSSVTELFNPQNPIQYGEFRTWAIAYLNTASSPSAEIPQPELAKQPNATNESHTTNPMNPINLMILPSEMQWGDHRLTETHPLTREDVCALYVFLSQQEATARSLNEDEIEATAPGQKQVDPDVVSPDEALSQFKDWAAIDGWARRYVAVAYRDKLMNTLFGLTATQLTVDDGFHPQQALTREEAIVLLHSLYGKAALEQQKTRAATNPLPSETNNPLNNIPLATPANSTHSNQPQPIAHLKTLQETGPNGTRRAVQINGPD
jgi:hypothetical protein